MNRRELIIILIIFPTGMLLGWELGKGPSSSPSAPMNTSPPSGHTANAPVLAPASLETAPSGREEIPPVVPIQTGSVDTTPRPVAGVPAAAPAVDEAAEATTPAPPNSPAQGQSAGLPPIDDPELLALPSLVRSMLPNTAFALSHAALKGDPTVARVALIVYGDFECPYSQESSAVLRSLYEQYKEKLVVAFRHLPQDNHPDGKIAALAAIAAQKQNKFWEFHDKVFARPTQLDNDTLEQYATELGLDMEQFAADRTSEESQAQLEIDRLLAASIESTATPTFLVNGRKLLGALPIATFQTLIDSEISRVESRVNQGKSLVQARGEVTNLNMMRNRRYNGGNGRPESLRRVPRADAPAQGVSDPTVAIVVFSDFQCTFCEKVREPLKRLVADYPQELQLLFRHAPQSEQAEALLAAQASMAAHSQGKFWEFHDRLFDRPDALGAAALRNHAVALGLDLERFDKNLREETFLGQINRDRDLADQLQLTVNPTLFINGRLIEGSRTYEELKEVVESCRTQASKLQAQGAPTAGYYEYLMELAPRDTETPPAP